MHTSVHTSVHTSMHTLLYYLWWSSLDVSERALILSAIKWKKVLHSPSSLQIQLQAAELALEITLIQLFDTIKNLNSNHLNSTNFKCPI